MILAFGYPIDLVLLLALSLVALSVLYALTLWMFSRREPEMEDAPGLERRVDPHRYDVVFVMPCLNEEQVLAGSLERLLSLDHPGVQVVVVDDASSDGTAAVAHSQGDPRVHVLHRQLPHAQQGKGEALNAAFRAIEGGEFFPVPDPDHVVVVVVDADGRLDPEALQRVLPIFDDRRIGGVQIGVRINNRRSSLLARMQDIEFVLYTDVFQRGRRHLGSVGLGGNGQFVRLSALRSLGATPWTRSLAEDLDLGVRLLIAGWRLDFCSDVAVHQQGLVDVGRWVRQRTRWFQGHLQAWALIPSVLRQLKGWARFDIFYHLTNSFLLIVASFLSAAFGFWILSILAGITAGHVEPSWWWLSAYIFAVGPALLYSGVYRRRERDAGLGVVKSFLLMHAYVGYAVLWYVAAYLGAWRMLTRQTGWAKTDRTADVPPDGSAEEPAQDWDLVSFGSDHR